MPAKVRSKDGGDALADKVGYVSEWFGHRVYPKVAHSPDALADQESKRCPFLSKATAEHHVCIKADNASGVCTISACSNGPRQDWLVCPFRALEPEILQDAAKRIFRLKPNEPMSIVPAPVLAESDKRQGLEEAIRGGNRGFVYLHRKLGGEISLSATKRSPELSFDITIVEILPDGDRFKIGSYGVLEIQTMDFHGTYQHVVRNLNEALRLHRVEFPVEVQKKPRWLSEKIEGPNLANVFKRTFYQMMLKYQIAGHGDCAGCVFAIPASVWDSWQKHLGAPELLEMGNKQFALRKPGAAPTKEVSAWIYIFDIEQGADSPNPIRLQKVIVTDADALSHYAFKVAPEAALQEGGSLLTTIQRRLAEWWPELTGVDAARGRRRVRREKPQ